MVTRKRKGGKITNKTRRNIERRLRNVDMSQESINASRRVLTKQQQIASEALDRAVEKTAQGIRIGSKALAKVAQDPEAMKSLAETIEAVGNATAKVAENSGEIAADMVEKFGPAFKQWFFWYQNVDMSLGYSYPIYLLIMPEGALINILYFTGHLFWLPNGCIALLQNDKPTLNKVITHPRHKVAGSVTFG